MSSKPELKVTLATGTSVVYVPDRDTLDRVVAVCMKNNVSFITSVLASDYEMLKRFEYLRDEGRQNVAVIAIHGRFSHGFPINADKVIWIGAKEVNGDERIYLQSVARVLNITNPRASLFVYESA